MKTLSRLLPLLLSLALAHPAQAGNAGDPKLDDVLASIKTACLAGELSVWANHAYEPALAKVGGIEALRARFKNAEQVCVQKKIKMLRLDFVAPYQFVDGANRRFVIVPTVTEIKTDQGIVHDETFNIAIENAPGDWQFLIEQSRPNTTVAAIRKLFPDFPGTVKLPEHKHTVTPPTS